jgi:hypothetical protein
MDKEEIVNKVVAMLDATQQVYDRLKTVNTPEELDKILNKLKLGLRTISFLQGAKEAGVFKQHWKIKGMEDLWRSWARENGIKEGHFLFEN